MDIPWDTEFESLRKDTDLGLTVARAISKRHGFSCDCSVVTVRSQLVFSSADRHIIKVFSPEDADFHKTETVFLSNLYQRLPIHTPELVASGCREGLPYIVMEKLHGLPLDRVWSEIPAGEQRRLVVLLGEAVHALHSLPVDLFASAPFQWNPFIDHQRYALLDNHRRYGLDAEWLDQLRQYIDDCRLDPHNPDLLVPLHTELMQEHIFLRESRGQWTVSGLIDFEPSIVGHVEYEFCAVGLFLSRGDKDLFRLFLSSYGYGDSDLTAEMSRRIMGFLLLHRYSNLKWFLTFLPPDAHVTRLAELEQYWYGV
jgi:hygromycin-B 7''-O-kinase